MFDVIALHQAIAQVCPIEGVSVGRREDRTTWRIDFAPEATVAERAAAQEVLAAFIPRDPESAEPHVIA